MIAQRIAAALFALSLPLAGHAGQAPDAPAGVSVGHSALGRVYIGKNGHTLYGMSLRSVRARTSLTLTYCTGPCAAAWTPLKPERGAKPVGSWTIVDGAQGAQWALDGSPVFAFNTDSKPGDVGGDRWKDLFLALVYVPPKPALDAPPSVDARLVDTDYILTDNGGRALYTSRCAAACGDRVPFAAGVASLAVGEWTVLRERDQPQWAWRGTPVFVSEAAGAATVPTGDTLLKPRTERQ